MNGSPAGRAPRLLAVSDLHVEHEQNRAVVSRLVPESDADWLILCGDVADSIEGVEWALATLAGRFAKVIWTPGNHELLTHRDDPTGLRGGHRYEHLVKACRSLGVVTPEDPYPCWTGPGGPATVAPLFLLYDYSFGQAVAPTKAEAMRRAHAAGVVCVDEYLLHPDPYPSREAWCHARVLETERRLAERPAGVPTILAGHFPLISAPTRALIRQEFAQWCGTTRTADWHVRFEAEAVVYGHLHIPRTTWHDGVRFEEVSLGYPRERARRSASRAAPRTILPIGEAR